MPSFIVGCSGAEYGRIEYGGLPACVRPLRCAGSSDPVSAPTLVHGAADDKAADVDPFPKWFTQFLNDRQTRKPQGTDHHVEALTAIAEALAKAGDVEHADTIVRSTLADDTATEDQALTPYKRWHGSPLNAAT